MTERFRVGDGFPVHCPGDRHTVFDPVGDEVRVLNETSTAVGAGAA